MKTKGETSVRAGWRNERGRKAGGERRKGGRPAGGKWERRREDKRLRHSSRDPDAGARLGSRTSQGGEWGREIMGNGGGFGLGFAGLELRGRDARGPTPCGRKEDGRRAVRPAGGGGKGAGAFLKVATCCVKRQRWERYAHREVFQHRRLAVTWPFGGRGGWKDWPPFSPYTPPWVGGTGVVEGLSWTRFGRIPARRALRPIASAFSNNSLRCWYSSLNT